MAQCNNCGTKLLGSTLAYQGQQGSYCSMDCLGQAEKGGGSGKVPQLTPEVGFGDGGNVAGNNPNGSGMDGQLYTDPETVPTMEKTNTINTGGGGQLG